MHLDEQIAMARIEEEMRIAERRQAVRAARAEHRAFMLQSAARSHGCQRSGVHWTMPAAGTMRRSVKRWAAAAAILGVLILIATLA